MQTFKNRKQIFSGLLVLLGGLVVLFTRNYHEAHRSSIDIGKWIGVCLMISSLFALMEWKTR